MVPLDEPVLLLDLLEAGTLLGAIDEGAVDERTTDEGATDEGTTDDLLLDSGVLLGATEDLLLLTSVEDLEELANALDDGLLDEAGVPVAL